LINTRLHVADTDFAVDKGLCEGDFGSLAFEKNVHAGKADFIELGKRIGILESRIEKLLSPFLEKQDKVETPIGRSFLNDSSKRGYLIAYNTKRNYLNAQ